MDFTDNDGLGNADIGVLLQDLETYIEKCSRVPLTGKIMAEGDFILETIDKINAILPEEMKQAKQVLEQSDKILESIEAQGKKMLDDARAQAEKIVQETEIVQMAQQEAEKIISEAKDYCESMVNKQSDQIIGDAEAYINSLLAHLEGNLDKVVEAVKTTRDSFEISRKG